MDGWSSYRTSYFFLGTWIVSSFFIYFFFLLCFRFFFFFYRIYPFLPFRAFYSLSNWSFRLRGPVWCFSIFFFVSSRLTSLPLPLMLSREEQKTGSVEREKKREKESMHREQSQKREIRRVRARASFLPEENRCKVCHVFLYPLILYIVHCATVSTRICT